MKKLGIVLAFLWSAFAVAQIDVTPTEGLEISDSKSTTELNNINTLPNPVLTHNQTLNNWVWWDVINQQWQTFGGGTNYTAAAPITLTGTEFGLDMSAFDFTAILGTYPDIASLTGVNSGDQDLSGYMTLDTDQNVPSIKSFESIQIDGTTAGFWGTTYDGGGEGKLTFGYQNIDVLGGGLNVAYTMRKDGLAPDGNNILTRAVADQLYLGGGGGGGTDDQNANEVPYDNTSSGLTATDTQAAIDELASSNGSSNPETVISETDYQELTTQEQTNYRGFRVQPIGVPDLYPQNSPESSSDTSDISTWTNNGSNTTGISLETTIVEEGSNAVRLDVVQNDSDTSSMQRSLTVEENTDYKINFRLYAEGTSFVWQVRVPTNSTGNGFSTQFQKTTASSGSWASGSIDFSTGSGETEVELVIRTINSSVTGHLAILDKVTLNKIEVLPDVKDFSDAITSYKSSDTRTDFFNYNIAENVFYDDSETNIGSNNLQSIIKKFNAKTDALEGRSSYDWYINISNEGTYVAVPKPPYDILEHPNLDPIIEHIRINDWDPYKTTSGKHGVSIKFGNGQFQYNTTQTISGIAEGANWEDIQMKWVMHGSGNTELFLSTAQDAGLDGWVFGGNMRLSLRDLKFGITRGNGSAIKLQAEGNSYSVIDSDLSRIDVFGDTSPSTSNLKTGGVPLAYMENMFHTYIDLVRVRNVGGSGSVWENVGTTTNYGNNEIGRYNSRGGNGALDRGLLVTTDGSLGRIYNLLNIGYLDVTATSNENGGADGIGLETTNGVDNVSIGMLVSEYLPIGAKLGGNSNFTLDKFVMTMNRGTNYVGDMIGFQIDNPQQVQINSGLMYSTEQSNTIPLEVDFDDFKFGNRFTFEVQNGIDPNNSVFTGNMNADIDVWENGAMRRLVKFEQNRPYNGVAIDPTTVTGLTTETNLEEALETAIAQGSGGSTVSTNTSFSTYASDVLVTSALVKGPDQQSRILEAATSVRFRLGGLITENKYFQIVSPPSSVDSVTVVPEPGFNFVGKDANGDYVDVTFGGLTFKDFEKVNFIKRDADTYWFDGKADALFFGDLAGSSAFPNSTNITLTTATTVTTSLVSGSPNKLRVTSDNNLTSDFGTQLIITNPTIGDVYDFTGEILVDSGTIGHAQIREVGGNLDKFEANVGNTSTPQTFSLSITITGTGDLVIDLPTDGAAVYSLMNVTKQ